MLVVVSGSRPCGESRFMAMGSGEWAWSLQQMCHKCRGSFRIHAAGPSAQHFGLDPDPPRPCLRQPGKPVHCPGLQRVGAMLQAWSPVIARFRMPLCRNVPYNPITGISLSVCTMAMGLGGSLDPFPWVPASGGIDPGMGRDACPDSRRPTRMLAGLPPLP